MGEDLIVSYVRGWWALVAYCEAPAFDRKTFRMKHDAWAKPWGRLRQDQQGEISALISAGVQP